MTQRPHLLDLNAHSFSQWLENEGHPAFRAEQIRRWIYQGRAETFEDMSNLPKGLRQQLESSFRLWSTTIARQRKAKDGSEKLLLQMADGGRIECVLLRDGERRSICISSQVGCAMGCVFCASGLDGVERNLTKGEMIEQMLRLQHLLPKSERLSHIVVMGMGEPLANVDHLLQSLEQASSEDGLGISPRRITISTVGLPQAMRRLTERGARYQLAVSLHAPNDPLRTELVPANAKVGIAKIMSEADCYFAESGRRLTFEYVLLSGINDQAKHAEELAALLGNRTAMLNVIPYNPVVGLPYETPSPAAVMAFREILLQAGVNVQFRQRKGDEIEAACGQLRRSTSVAADFSQVSTDSD
jgi:23S rRNA (adenine2503-C2)-methyltransferase